jgi:hypothetical protein
LEISSLNYETTKEYFETIKITDLTPDTYESQWNSYKKCNYNVRNNQQANVEADRDSIPVIIIAPCIKGDKVHTEIRHLIHPPDVTDIEHFIDNQFKWYIREKPKHDVEMWEGWIKEHETTENIINKCIGDWNKQNKDMRSPEIFPYEIAKIIDNRRKLTPGLFQENLQLICPCLIYCMENPSSTQRYNICNSLTNKVGLKGTHDKTIWRECTVEYFKRNSTLQHKTDNHYYCMCLKKFNSQENRNQRIKTVLDEQMHGDFFDEQPKSGGCFIILDTITLKVIKTGSFPIENDSEEKMHSTKAEAITWIKAIKALKNIRSENMSHQKVTISTDSQATSFLVENHVENDNPQTVTQKSPMRTIITNMKKAFKTITNNINIKTDHHKNEHDARWDSDHVNQISTRLNMLCDIQAGKEADESGQTTIEINPTTKIDIEDFGSKMDCRADPTKNNEGDGVTVTTNGLKYEGDIKQLIRTQLAIIHSKYAMNNQTTYSKHINIKATN